MGRYVIKEYGRGTSASYHILLNGELVAKKTSWLEVLRVIGDNSYKLLKWGEF